MANKSLSSAASANVYFNLDFIPASSSFKFISSEISLASLTFGDSAVLIPSSTLPKILPFNILLAALINLAAPTPRTPAVADIPAVLKASPNNSS